MNKEDKKLQKHLVNEMMKVSITNPDVMIYMQALMESYEKLEQEIDRLKKIARKMHAWIFLNSNDEQKVYDELGLTDEDNTMLGYSGQIKIVGDKE